MNDISDLASLGFEAHVRGGSAEEIEGFPSFVASLDPPPDVVFLDENLDHPNGRGAGAAAFDLGRPMGGRRVR